MSNGKLVAGAVCYISDQGTWICDSTMRAAMLSAAERKAVRTALRDKADPNRIKLILALIEEVLAAPIDDDCVGKRTKRAAQTLQLVLAKKPPSMIMYRTSKLPGEVLGTYYVNQQKFDAARGVLDYYANPEPAC